MNKKLRYVPFEEAEDGMSYITEMKHGWISGDWDAKTKMCYGYYWSEMSWYPEALYLMEDEI